MTTALVTGSPSAWARPSPHDPITERVILRPVRQVATPAPVHPASAWSGDERAIRIRETDYRPERAEFVGWLEHRLNELLALKAGWDMDGAQPVTLLAVGALVRAADALIAGDELEPQVSPMPDGGLQMAWIGGSDFIDLQVDAAGELVAVAQVGSAQISHEGEPPPGLLVDLRAAIVNFTERVQAARLSG